MGDKVVVGTDIDGQDSRQWMDLIFVNRKEKQDERQQIDHGRTTGTSPQEGR